MSISPTLLLETQFALNDERRIVQTREPYGKRGPSLAILHGRGACAWAVNAALPADLARALEALAAEERGIASLAHEEPTLAELQAPPLHLARYRSLLADHDEVAGPEFAFPALAGERDPEVVEIREESLLNVHFRGWIAGEIAAGSAPVMAICDAGVPVSVCFSARSAPFAAEAGLETAAAYRGRGLAARVTTAWAQRIREQGRTPLYSTSWMNAASLANARKLGLQPFAASWSFTLGPA